MPPSSRPSSQNVIVLNEDGLDEASLTNVLSPFANSRRFVGISVAAEGEGASQTDDLLDEELTAFAQASARS